MEQENNKSGRIKTTTFRYLEDENARGFMRDATNASPSNMGSWAPVTP